MIYNNKMIERVQMGSKIWICNELNNELGKLVSLENIIVRIPSMSEKNVQILQYRC